jgi:hypothetical protein
MTTEEKQLLIIDLCARLPYETMFYYDRYGEECLLSIDLEYNKVNELYSLEEIKPYLRPMSSMTEEEIKEFSAFGFEVVNHINANRDECPKYQVIEVSNFSEITKVTDWLNKKMLDYRGLIPMGLALEAPEGMY